MAEGRSTFLPKRPLARLQAYIAQAELVIRRWSGGRTSLEIQVIHVIAALLRGARKSVGFLVQHLQLLK